MLSPFVNRTARKLRLHVRYDLLALPASYVKRWAFSVTKYAALASIAGLFVGCATTPPTCQEARGVVELNQQPIYPSESKKLKQQGKTTLNVLVNQLGYVQEVKLRQSSGHKNLDESAIEAVKTWCFSPATNSGKTVDAWVLVPIDFRLTDN